MPLLGLRSYTFRIRFSRRLTLWRSKRWVILIVASQTKWWLLIMRRCRKTRKDAILMIKRLRNQEHSNSWRIWIWKILTHWMNCQSENLSFHRIPLIWRHKNSIFYSERSSWRSRWGRRRGLQNRRVRRWRRKSRSGRNFGIRRQRRICNFEILLKQTMLKE